MAILNSKTIKDYLSSSIDPSSKQLITIDNAHANVHEGQVFVAFERTTGVTGASLEEMLLQIPSGIEAHAVFTVSISGSGIVFLLEGVTLSTAGAGSTIPVMNRNRSSTRGTSILVSEAPGIISTATENTYEISFLPIANRYNIFGTNESFPEVILKQNTNYILRVQNASGANEDIAIQCDFYEVSISS